MICKDCTKKNHNDCKERNASKQGTDCDCQHRTEAKIVVNS